MLKFLRKYQFFTSLFLLATLTAFSGFHVQAAFSEEYSEIGNKVEFNRIIQICSTEYLTAPTIDRVQLQVLHMIKTFFDSPSFFGIDPLKNDLTLHGICSGLYPVELSPPLDKICKLQI
jgi:hypothetical protein